MLRILQLLRCVLRKFKDYVYNEKEKKLELRNIGGAQNWHQTRTRKLSASRQNLNLSFILLLPWHVQKLVPTTIARNSLLFFRKLVIFRGIDPFEKLTTLYREC